MGIMKVSLKRILTPIIACTASLAVIGCTDAQRAKIGGYGSPHHVELYSGGQKVREWVSSGKVDSEQESDGYYFNDMSTGKLIEVSGDVVITKLKNQAEAEELIKSLKY